jgi:hypothetical protein
MNLYKVFYSVWDEDRLRFFTTGNGPCKMILAKEQAEAAAKLRHLLNPALIEIAEVRFVWTVDIV